MMYRLHREGGVFLLASFLLAVLASLLIFFFFSAWTILFLAAALSLLVLFLVFFRNPPRAHGAVDPDAILAPADGKVVVIEEILESEYLQARALQVSIFMSPLNVHVNRSPVKGEVVYQQYHPGKYLVAWHPKSSELNERCTVVIRHKTHPVLLRQIAGTLARKIVTYTKPGDQLQRGEEFGFIKFGSRVDVILPLGSEVLVRLGQRVSGGVTVLARFAG